MELIPVVEKVMQEMTTLAKSLHEMQASHAEMNDVKAALLVAAQGDTDAAQSRLAELKRLKLAAAAGLDYEAKQSLSDKPKALR